PTPKPKPHENDDKEVDALMKVGKFSEAETILRNCLPGLTGMELAENRYLLGVCVASRAKAVEPRVAGKLYAEATECFEQASTKASEASINNKQAAWIRTQSELRCLQILHQTEKANDLIVAATTFMEKHPDTIEELIALSLVYHALRQRGEPDKAREVRD